MKSDILTQNISRKNGDPTVIMVMVYFNFELDYNRIYDNLNVQTENVIYDTRKKDGKVIPDTVIAPYGTIYAASRGTKNDIKGLDLLKKNKKKVNKKGNFFLNQFMYYVSLGKQEVIDNKTGKSRIEGKNANIMVFKDNIKIAGCKTISQAAEVAMLFWENVVRIDPKNFIMGPNWVDYPDIHMLFEVVLNNNDLILGFNINKHKLNDLMNNEKYKDIVKLSKLETSKQPNVNIKLFAKKPDVIQYNVLVYPNGSKPISVSPLKYSEEPSYFIMTTDKTKYHKEKIKNKTTTIIVFSSSQIIISGCYDECILDAYNFTFNEIKNNRNLIEEHLRPPEQPFSFS